jgi:hypothetical protein
MPCQCYTPTSQAPVIAAARPLAATLDILDDPEDDNEDGVDPDVIKALLEDALVLLDNANIRLNNWLQKRFSEFLTEVGKGTLKEDIPTDKHLFPDQLHKAIQSEYDHSSRNSKLIATPFKQTPREQQFKKSFRYFSQMEQNISSGANASGPTKDLVVGSSDQHQIALISTKGLVQRKDDTPKRPIVPIKVDYNIPKLTEINHPALKTACRLAYFQENWEKITSDKWVLQPVKG